MTGGGANPCKASLHISGILPDVKPYLCQSIDLLLGSARGYQPKVSCVTCRTKCNSTCKTLRGKQGNQFTTMDLPSTYAEEVGIEPTCLLQHYISNVGSHHCSILPCYMLCGGNGIRTHGGITLSCFQDNRTSPLCDPA